ncbi:hypothetical protein G1H10_08325 [Phytoactinopolyspora halotolerans]|uniref:Phosphotyrosine protein phosphatase I domain-containing protein n=1 Tax=Phytoactinopolyspora halotolerans TaxID=1981512 RepID=A0A6L9S405_9ACTN|nr:hypothetical protein [Phytoactinopolyspora halotolerans]
MLAERLARRYMVGRRSAFVEQFHVSSAGTQAIPGRPMHPYVGDVLRLRDADVGDFASRRLTGRLVSESDLVLTATTEERDRAISMAPAALGMTFAMCEFARLVSLAEHGYEGLGEDAFEHERSEGFGRLDGDTARTARSVVSAVHRIRGQAPYAPPTTDDIPDPLPTRKAFEECADHVEASVLRGLDFIRRAIDDGHR